MALAPYTPTVLTNRMAPSLTSSLRPRPQLRRQRSFSTQQMETTRLYVWISPTHTPRLPPKAAGGKRPKGPQGLITTFLLKPHVPRSLTWVGSHPDLKPEKVGCFEDEDYGIYFADKIAGKESLTPTRDGREVKETTVINGDDVITDLLSVNRFTKRYIDTPARPLLKRFFYYYLVLA